MGRMDFGFRVSSFEFRVSPNNNRLLSAPEADLGLADAVDGAVFPLGQGGGEGLGVGVAGGGVVAEVDPAVAAIDLDLQHVQVRAVAAPGPVDEDLAGDDPKAEDGLHLVEVGGNGFAAQGAEIAGDAVDVVDGFLDDLDKAEDAIERTWEDGRDGWQAVDGGGQGRWGKRWAAPVAWQRA